MRLKRAIPAVAVAVGFVCLAISGAAQNEERFKARLSPVPIERAMQSDIKGGGSATGVLAGSRLTITASFTGLAGPATVARLHRGMKTGVRGSAFQDIAVPKATSGTITATVNLTSEQAESLRKGQIYIQIHSEKAPEGNLWGWLLR
jgi:hypothetical protein